MAGIFRENNTILKYLIMLEDVSEIDGVFHL